MRPVLASGVALLVLAAGAFAGANGGATSEGGFSAGIGCVDITPAEEVTLAGSPSPKKASAVDTRLFVKSLVLSLAGQKLAIVTLDTLKYPADLALAARQQIEQTVGIPAGRVIICASHTHSAPLWAYYPDKLLGPIRKAVALAAEDLAPCRLGTSRGTAEGLSENRRVLIDGEAWNRWQLKLAEHDQYPAAGPADPQLDVLAVVGSDGRYRALLYNYACHAANTRSAMISADYPGHVQRYVEEHLGYCVPTLFLTGACGDVNPDYRQPSEAFGKRLGEALLESLGGLEYIAHPILRIESREDQMPGREHPEFNAEEIARKWPGQLEHYRKAFEAMRRQERPTYKFCYTGIRIGDDFAIVTNPDELFCEIGMSIKQQSPFKHTMVVEQTNGALGYVPTARAFAEGGYETWYGEHSYMSVRAGDIVGQESLEILEPLRKGL